MTFPTPTGNKAIIPTTHHTTCWWAGRHLPLTFPARCPHRATWWLRRVAWTRYTAVRWWTFRLLVNYSSDWRDERISGVLLWRTGVIWTDIRRIPHLRGTMPPIPACLPGRTWMPLRVPLQGTH